MKRVNGHKETVLRGATQKVQTNQVAPRLISLFCGVGGLDLGFQRAGFQTAFAVDHDDDAVRTFNSNSAHSPAVVGDLVELGVRGTMKLIRERVPSGATIGVIGGPPCQGFSQANSNASVRDPRNRLPGLYVKIVKALCRTYKVKFIVFENVAGLLSKKYVARYKAIKREIRRLGFELFDQTLNAADYGVPQARRRLFLIGLRAKHAKQFKFPMGQGKPRTVREAIGHLPPPAYFAKDLRPQEIPTHRNHWTMKPKSARFRSGVRINGAWKSFKKLSWRKPSRTIAFGHREILVHPTGRRRLSIFEAMLLQGFPKRFHLLGTLSSQVTQVSNAVPPPLAHAVARSLKSALHAQAYG